jgi:hypothetical protein
MKLGSEKFDKELVQRHDKLVSDFIDAVEMYLKASRELKQRFGSLSQSSKDVLSEYWDWSEKLIREYAITGAMGDENLVNNVLLKTTIGLVEQASWNAFEIYKKAYIEWSQDRKSTAKKDRLAESTALLEVNLHELHKLDRFNETITEIGNQMMQLGSA